MNKIVSTYSFNGDSPIDLAAGIAIHEGGNLTLPTGKSIAGVWDTPQSPSAGRIATGIVALPAEHATAMTAANHALLIFKRHSVESFTYFAGSGWSKPICQPRKTGILIWSISRNCMNTQLSLPGEENECCAGNDDLRREGFETRNSK